MMQDHHAHEHEHEHDEHSEEQHAKTCAMCRHEHKKDDGGCDCGCTIK